MNITTADNYVPKEDRIAVFDFDGTIFQENDPIYNDYKLYYIMIQIILQQRNKKK